MSPSGRTRIFRALDGTLEQFQVHQQTHVFPRHAHPELTVTLIHQGELHFEQHHHREVAGVHQLVVTPAGEPHQGGSRALQEVSYFTLYVSLPLLQDLGLQAEHFTPGVWTHPGFTRRCLQVCRAMHLPTEALQVQEHLLDLLEGLQGPPAHRETTGSTEMRTVQAHLQAHFRTAVTLQDLARQVDWHPVALVRAFRKFTGLPPHRYLQHLRVQHARRLLLQGHPLARAAVDAGFADQSHFTRTFRQVYGVSPGKYVQGSKRSRP